MIILHAKQTKKGFSRSMEFKHNKMPKGVARANASRQQHAKRSYDHFRQRVYIRAATSSLIQSLNQTLAQIKPVLLIQLLLLFFRSRLSQIFTPSSLPCSGLLQPRPIFTAFHPSLNHSRTLSTVGSSSNSQSLSKTISPAHLLGLL